jgi:hypothetical protein
VAATPATPTPSAWSLPARTPPASISATAWSALAAPWRVGGGRGTRARCPSPPPLPPLCRQVQTAYECLFKAIERVKPGELYRSLGGVIQPWAERNGCSVVHIVGSAHCRFRKRGADYFSESSIKPRRCTTIRQCDRTLGAHLLRPRRQRALPLRAHGLGPYGPFKQPHRLPQKIGFFVWARRALDSQTGAWAAPALLAGPGRCRTTRRTRPRARCARARPSRSGLRMSYRMPSVHARRKNHHFY